jgi:hypothetical protein
MDHFDIHTDLADVAHISDAHGNWVGDATHDANGLTFHDAHGSVVGYDHEFGGVDHFLDSHGHELGSLDPLGTVHEAHGSAIAHLTESPNGIDVLNMHNQVIAQLRSDPNLF